MEGLFTCLERATCVLLLSPKPMLYTRVRLRSPATLSVSHVYTFRPQRVKPSC